MAWKHKYDKVKKVNLNVEFSEDNVILMRKIKDAKNDKLTWGEFFFYAAVNVRSEKKEAPNE